MTDPKPDGVWFEPRQWGYGAGWPIAWQGWGLMLTHVGVILGGSALMRQNHAAQIAWIVIAAVLPLPLYHAKTRGGWKWRWPG